MADQRRMGRVGLAFIQQGLQSSCGSIKKEGFDAVGHVSFLPQSTQRNTEDRRFILTIEKRHEAHY